MNSIQVMPGTTLRVWLGGYWHYGILAHGGLVIHNSKQQGRVVEEPFQLFSEGNRVELCQEIGSKNLALACFRARQFLGLTYSLFSQNCEHFVRVAHGLIPESPQVQKATLVAAGLGIMSITENPRLQLTAAMASLGSVMAPKGTSPVVGALWGTLLGSVLSLSL